MVIKTQEHKHFHEDLQYHRHEWLTERIGWLAMFLLIVAALLGLFGDGPLSHRTVGDPRTATLAYERFLRFASPTLLELSVAKSQQGTISVEVNESYLRDFEITSITPNPRSAALVGDRHRLEFDAAAVPATIAIRVTPEKVGSVRGSISVAGTQLDFSQFVYP